MRHNSLFLHQFQCRIACILKILLPLLCVACATTAVSPGLDSDINRLFLKLKSSDNHVRIAASEKLLKMGTSIEDELLRHLQDSSEQMKIHIIWTLGELGKKRYAPPIIRYIDTSHDVTRYVLVALGKIGDPETIPVIASKLKDKSRYIRTDAARAFGRIGDIRAIPHLVSAIHDTDWHIREAVAKSLGEIGGAEALKHLRDLAEKDPDGVVQAWAYDGLERAGAAIAE